MDYAYGNTKERVVESLVRTLEDAFDSANNLHTKLVRDIDDIDDESEHRHHRRQSRGRRDSSSKSDVRDRSRLRNKDSRSKSRTRNIDYARGEDMPQSMKGDVRAEYIIGCHRFGEGFAVGDSLAQNQLHQQIIDIQKAIIDIYREWDRHALTDHLKHLLQHARSAQVGATQALTDLHRRLVPKTGDMKIPGAFPRPSSPSDKTIHPKAGDSHGIVRRPSRANIQPIPRGLFCPYASDLQKNPNQKLADAYLEAGSGRCPYCRVNLGTQPGKAWEIVMEDARRRDENEAFWITNRFLVKCHREGGGFACVLCCRFRETDTACKEIPDLMHHIWGDHSGEELEDDDDVDGA